MKILLKHKLAISVLNITIYGVSPRDISYLEGWMIDKCGLEVQIRTRPQEAA